MGCVIFIAILIYRFNPEKIYNLKDIQFCLSIIFVLLIGYSGLCLLLFNCRWMLSLVTPLLVWQATTISVIFCLLWERQKHLIFQQKYQIAQLKAAEQEAIVFRTRKLLLRTAGDIHDFPLQKLKVVMDKIELNEPIDKNFFWDNLESIGREIREQLNNIRCLAARMEINPRLRQGLHLAIENTLEELVNSRKLTLEVNKNIQPLTEALYDSTWIEHREEIFRFFREAIANVMKHAQPPYGNATKVNISLYQQEERCTLTIENDGIINEINNNNNGGFGIQMMQTIATELPGGSWEKILLDNDNMRIILSWDL